MEMGLKKIIDEQVTGGSGGPGKKGNTGGGPGKTGGAGKTGGNTGGSSGGGVTPAVTQQPAVTPTVTASPPPVTPPITKQDPVTKKEPKPLASCVCWTTGNFFKKFGDKSITMADDFHIFARKKLAKTGSFAEGGTYSQRELRIQTMCGDTNCLPHQTPLTREIAGISINDNETLFDVWENSKIEKPKPAEPEPVKSTIGYLNLSDPSDFFSSAQNTVLFKTNKNDFATNWRDLKNLYDSSVNFKEKRNCRDTADAYLNLYNNGIENSFGDPDSSEEEDYEVRKKYWYGFLNVLLTIKSNLRKCVANGIKFDDDVANSIASISNIWEINMFDNKTSRKDKEAMALAKQNLATEQSVIRKKLIEYKEMKTLKESVRNKILLTKENKDKKVNKISENLYKIAGDFYNDRYDVFFEKYVRLKESYKKSKMFLTEGASDNFKNAFVRVFKGDEEELVRVAIPWFTSKLGLEGTVKAEVEEKLRNKYSGDDIADLFEDDWSDIVVSSIINNAKSDVSEPTNAMDAVEKALMSNMRADFKEDLKNSIKNLIYPVQDSRKTEIVNLANELKNAILASKDGEESQEDTDSKVDDIFS